MFHAVKSVKYVNFSIFYCVLYGVLHEILFHKFTHSHKILREDFGHNKYIILYIIILLWRFFQDTQMCESVNL